MMQDRDGWTNEIWRRLEGILDFGWNAHLAELNARFNLGPDYYFSMHGPGEPPTFFNGDVDALQPGRWVLVVSLNPHQVKGVKAPLESQFDQRFATLAAYWDFWRTYNYNTKTWYASFYRPLVHVAAGALGEEVPQNAEPAFATTRMLFLELCPYYSPRFGLHPQKVADLVECDHGFRIAHDILHIAAGKGQPALILVNGNAAIASLDASEGSHVKWSDDTRYLSESKQGKWLHHREGVYITAHGPVPIAGFPFLRTMHGHNSYEEIAQLTSHLRTLISPRG